MRGVLVAGSGLAALASTMVLVCGGGNLRGPHQVLDRAAEPLRTQFDLDSGKVRAIFLASPT